MPGFKHPCRYCDKLVPPNSNVCPFCGKINPKGPTRCPVCRNPISSDYKVCAGCGLELKTVCPECGKETFLGDYCEHCDVRLLVVCTNKKCGHEQPPIGDKCLKCGKPLK
ncbi:MAG: hypothetical protein R6V47_07760 [Candidatus Delongbacteria bacterium]